MKILFLYDVRLSDEHLWKDGLWQAVHMLESEHEVTWHNLVRSHDIDPSQFDAVLCRGDWSGHVDTFMESHPHPRACLYLCGNVQKPQGRQNKYKTIFYEHEWQLPIEHHNLIHAFGINTKINYPMNLPKAIDWLTVGAFANWKRQPSILDKPGVKMAVGDIQKDNLEESSAIVGQLILGGCGVMDMIPTESLAVLYNLSRSVYIPANVNGGGERAVQEARACGIPVEVAEDNPKLRWFATTDIFTEEYLYQQLLKGL